MIAEIFFGGLLVVLFFYYLIAGVVWLGEILHRTFRPPAPAPRRRLSSFRWEDDAGYTDPGVDQGP